MMQGSGRQEELNKGRQKKEDKMRRRQEERKTGREEDWKYSLQFEITECILYLTRVNIPNLTWKY